MAPVVPLLSDTARAAQGIRVGQPRGRSKTDQTGAGDGRSLPLAGGAVFISHSWSYPGHYDRLVTLLEKRSCFSFKNHSVPKDDPIHNASSE